MQLSCTSCAIPAGAVIGADARRAQLAVPPRSVHITPAGSLLVPLRARVCYLGVHSALRRDPGPGVRRSYQFWIGHEPIPRPSAGPVTIPSSTAQTLTTAPDADGRTRDDSGTVWYTLNVYGLWCGGRGTIREFQVTSASAQLSLVELQHNSYSYRSHSRHA